MSSFMEELMFKLPKKPFTGKKVEAQFTEWFGSKIKNNGGHFWKLSDMDIRKKPYDAILTYRGIDAKIEFKQSNKKKTTDLYKMLLPNQVRGLKEVKESLGLPLVIYYNSFLNKYYIKEYSESMLLTIE